MTEDNAGPWNKEKRLWRQGWGQGKVVKHNSAPNTGGWAWGRAGWMGGAGDLRAVTRPWRSPQWWIHRDVHGPKPSRWTITRVSLNVNCGLWVMMIYPCRSISYNKCTTWWRALLMGEAVHLRGQGSPQDISVPFFQFCSESKAALKCVLFKRSAFPWYLREILLLSFS